MLKLDHRLPHPHLKKHGKRTVKINCSNVKLTVSRIQIASSRSEQKVTIRHYHSTKWILNVYGAASAVYGKGVHLHRLNSSCLQSLYLHKIQSIIFTFKMAAERTSSMLAECSSLSPSCGHGGIFALSERNPIATNYKFINGFFQCESRFGNCRKTRTLKLLTLK